MPRTTHGALAERRVNLADWVTAILSIFWSVWWGFFMNRILENPSSNIRFQIPLLDPPVYIDLPKLLYLVINVVVIAYFAVSYVHWLWNAQRTAYHSFLVSDLLSSSAPLGIAIISMLSSIGFVSYVYKFPYALFLYGVLLTTVWPLAVLVTLWKA